MMPSTLAAKARAMRTVNRAQTVDAQSTKNTFQFLGFWLSETIPLKNISALVLPGSLRFCQQTV
jgi:hypothetical protein